MRLHWNRNAVIWTTGIVAASAAGFGLMVRPQMQRLARLSDEVQQEQQAVQGADAIHAEMSRLKAEVEALNGRTSSFDKLVPEGERLGAFLEELARCAQNRQLKAEEIQPGKAVRSARITALPIACTLRGSFQGVFGLIKDLERMERLTLIDRLETKAQPGDSGEVVAQLNLRVYFRAS